MEHAITVCITGTFEGFEDTLSRAVVAISDCPMQCCRFGSLVIEFKLSVFEQKAEGRLSWIFICDNCFFFIVLDYFLGHGNLLRILQEEGGETFIAGGGGIEKDTKSLMAIADARNKIWLEEPDESVSPCTDNLVDPMEGKMVKDHENEVVW